MRFRSLGALLLLLAFWLTPQRAPAPLIYRPGEGWSYESESGGKWRRNRAKDQLEVAQQAFDAKKYSTAVKAARRVVSVWPLSDYAPRAQYLLARAYEERVVRNDRSRPTRPSSSAFPRSIITRKSSSDSSTSPLSTSTASGFTCGDFFRRDPTGIRPSTCMRS